MRVVRRRVNVSLVQQEVDRLSDRFQVQGLQTRFQFGQRNARH